MPLYEYLCHKCGTAHTAYRSIEARHDSPQCCGAQTEKQISAHMVNADIQPYKAVAVDKHNGRCPVINSRKQHKAFLKRNGYEEIGSEPVENLMKHKIRETHPIGGNAPAVSNINLTE